MGDKQIANTMMVTFKIKYKDLILKDYIRYTLGDLILFSRQAFSVLPRLIPKVDSHDPNTLASQENDVFYLKKFLKGKGKEVQLSFQKTKILLIK